MPTPNAELYAGFDASPGPPRGLVDDLRASIPDEAAQPTRLRAGAVMRLRANSWDGETIAKPRPSSLPMYMACSPSHLRAFNTPAVELTGDEPAELGTAVHHVLNLYLTGTPYEDCLRSASNAHHWFRSDVNPEDCAFLVQQGVKMFEAERHSYQYRPEAGLLMTCDDFEGTDDVHGVSDRVIKVGDFKSGWNLTPAYDQIMGYLWLLNAKYPGRELFLGDVYYLRHEKTVRIEKTIQGLYDWHAHYRSKNPASDSYCITEHCCNCRRVMTCPAIRQAAESFSRTTGDPMISHASNTSLASNLQYTLNAAKAVKRIVDAVDKARDAIVEQSGGVLSLPDGREYARSVRYRKEFNAAQALPVLQQLLGQAAVEDICKLSVASITRAVKRFMPGRPVRPIMRSIMEALANANAVQEVPYTVIRQQGENADPEE